MRNKFLFRFFTISVTLAALSYSVHAQTGVGISSSHAAADASAMLDVSSTSKGVLIPRVALTSTSSNAPVGASVTTSLLVYNTATTGDVTPGFYYWTGSAWTPIRAGNLTGDVTSSGNVTTVVKLNGTSLAGLATGILKNTTGTGVPSIAASGDFPTLNQNTTGTAANSTNAAITNDASTNADMFPVWATANSGNLPLKVSSTKLLFNPSNTGKLSIGTAANIGGVDGISQAIVIGNSYGAAPAAQLGSSIDFGTGTNGNPNSIKARIIGRSNSGNVNGYLDFYTMNNNTAADVKMTIDYAGNVGIGSNAPQSQLHLASNSNHEFRISRANNQYGFRIFRDATLGVIKFDIGTTSTPTWETKIQIGEGEGANTKLLLNPNGGNVGIGTTNPSVGHLQVQGTTSGQQIYSVSTATSGSNYGLDAEATGGTPTLNVGGYFVALNGTTNYGVQINSPGTGANNYALYSNAAAQSYFAGNVGIGTTSPTSILHTVASGAKTAAYSGNLFTNTATSSTASIIKSGVEITSTGTWNGTSASNIGLYVSSVSGGTNNYGIQIAGPGAASNNYALYSTADAKSYISGRVGIGTTTPGGALELGVDEGRKPSTSAWTIPSDPRLKTIEGEYSKGLQEILALQPIVYHYKNVGDRIFSDEVLQKQNTGFSAEDVQKVFPEAVSTDEDGYLNFNMHPILVSYINAFKEQQNMIEVLNVQLADLKARLEILEKK